MVSYAFTGLPVADLDSARAWYERLVGRPPDLIPNENEAAWRLTDTGAVITDPEGNTITFAALRWRDRRARTATTAPASADPSESARLEADLTRYDL